MEDYVLDSWAKEQLVKTGLEARIEKAVKNDKFHFLHGIFFITDFPNCIRDMGERGYYKAAPKNALAEHKQLMNSLYKEQYDGDSKNKWVVRKQDHAAEKQVESEDFLLFSGQLASEILTKKQFWNPEKFGFKSVFDLWGTIGARAVMLDKERRELMHQGYVWNSSEDSRQFVNEVTASSDGDFRLFRTEITPYPTIDPTGASVHYRPLLSEDAQRVAGYHSVEPALLVTLLKYAEQEQISLPVIEEKNLAVFLQPLQKQGFVIGNFGDFGHDPYGPSGHFVHYNAPIPKFSERQFASRHFVHTNFESTYRVYTGEDKRLVFTITPRNDESKETIALSLPSNETEHLIKGLFVQAAKGLGRTSVKQLVDIIGYRSSEQFKKDQEEWNEYIKKHS